MYEELAVLALFTLEYRGPSALDHGCSSTIEKVTINLK